VRGDEAVAGGAQRILVVGSYPPVRTPGTAATLAAVRRTIAAGAQPVVASPRSSAAHYAVAVTGVFAGRRLDNLRRVTGARRLVLCAERDLPLATSGASPVLLRLVQNRTLAEVRRASRGFDHVTVVLGDELDVPASLVAGLRAMADAVVEREAGAAGDPGVTVLGPDDRTTRERLVGLSRKAARRALGPLYPEVRKLAAAAVRRARATPGPAWLRAASRRRPGRRPPD
jgi:hypothetical protein